MSEHNQITLGELIRLLEARPDGQGVCFDFGALEPTGVASYRGYYAELAIGFGEHGLSLPKFIEELRAAVGTTFEGYKGGDYVMRETTPLWVANYGRSASTAVVGLCDCSFWTIIETKWVDM